MASLIGQHWDDVRDDEEPPVLEYTAACLRRDVAALVEAYHAASGDEREAAWANLEAAYIELHRIVRIA